MKAKHNIDFSDVQGLVRFAHGHLDSACFLLLKVRNAQMAGEWLKSAPVSSAESKKARPKRVLHIAFSSFGLKQLQLPETVLDQFSEEFISGMSQDANRSRRLGDLGNNSPEYWLWGGYGSSSAQQEAPQILLMIYARADDLDAWIAELTETTGEKERDNTLFNQAFTVQHKLQTASLGRKEPFGFDDGISQPEIDWNGDVSTDLHERDGYSNLLALGEMVLGYPNEYGLYTNRPLIDPAQDKHAAHLLSAEDRPTQKDLGRNGTYLVFRQLAQDVAGFWQSVDSAAGHKAEEREYLAAAMVGRQRDGTPLVSPSETPITGIKSKGSQAHKNNFNYNKDPHGQVCPIGAHIRRSNPRNGDFPVGVSGFFSRMMRIFGFGQRHPHDDVIASTRFHRILRRGRTYGSTLLPENAIKKELSEKIANEARGLHFVALGANISRQFEFVQAAWNMSTKFGGLSAERDPLIGHREPLPNGEASDQFTLPQISGSNKCLKNLPQFVTVVGGGYFFMPSLKVINYIAEKARLSDSVSSENSNKRNKL